VPWRKLQSVKEKRNILHIIKRRKDNWIGHILCRKCLLIHVIKRNIEGKGIHGRRRMQLLDDLKETRRYGNGKTKH
jgi:hypothetical protein